MHGPLNPNWRGGRTITAKGYVLVRLPGHHLADCRGYVYEHRLVAEHHLGRLLRDDEEVHHRNEIKGDNRWENLEVLTHEMHAVRHRRRRDLRLPGEPNPLVECRCGCGGRISKYDSDGRPRVFVSGHNLRRSA